MTVKDLGELGIEGQDENVDYTFSFHGERIRVHPAAGELSYLEFMGKASTLDVDDPNTEKEATLAVLAFLREQVHPDDYDLFYKTAKKRRYGLEQLMSISQAIIGAVSGFPTSQPSDSSGGHSKTPTRSKAISSSRGTVPRRGRRSKSEAALTLLKGRPDLQMAVVRAQEAAEAARLAG